MPVGGKLVDLLKFVCVKMLDIGEDGVELLDGLLFLYLSLI